MDETEAIAITMFLATIGLCILVPPVGVIMLITFICGAPFYKPKD